MANSHLTTVQYYAEVLVKDLQEGMHPDEAVQRVQDNIKQEQSLHRDNIAEVINTVGWKLYRESQLADVAALIEALDLKMWNESTERLRINLEGRNICVQVEKREETDLMRAKRLINEDRIEEGVELMRSIAGCGSGHFIMMGYDLLQKGCPVAAVRVIERVLAAELTVDSSGGVDMAAINLLARCAREDPKNVKDRFYQEIHKMQSQGGIPSECVQKAMHVFHTGNTKYKKVSSKNGRQKRTSPYKQKNNGFSWPGVIGEVPELDDTGDARRAFEMHIQKGQIGQALSLLLRHRNEANGMSIRLYEQQIFYAIGIEKYDTSTLEAMVKVDPKNEKLLMAGMQNLLKFSSFEEAGIFYCKYGRDNLRISRAFGQMLLQAQGKDDAFVMRAAETLLTMNRPVSTLEIIKPSLLEYIRSKADIPKNVLMIFARCAAADEDIRGEFLEQMYDYKRQNKVGETYFAKIMKIAFSDDENAVLEAQKTVHMHETPESEEHYVGRVSRSRFFNDPHALLKTKPVAKKKSTQYVSD